MADTLARIHSLPLPPASSPIPRQNNPFLETLEGDRAERHALPRQGRARLRRARRDRRGAAADARHGAGLRPSGRSRSPSRWPTRIPATSSSIATGIAWFVDLEKVHVGSPAIDLAHATLANLDAVASRCRQSAVTRRGAGLLRHYILRRSDRKQAARPCSRGSLPMRRLTWLRTTLVHGALARRRRAAPRDPADPTQWSDAGLEPAMKAHIDARIDQCFRRETIQIDPIRMDGLTRSLFVLRVDRSCRPTVPPDYPDDAIAEPVHRGRGALVNESSRFDSERRIRTTDGWETEASSSRRTTTSCRRCARR